jgi:PAS domain S-box-containing protein
MLASLEQRVTVLVTLLLVGVVGGIFWLSHSRVVEAVSHAELARLQASAGQVGQTLHAQARRILADANRIAALREMREALNAPTPRNRAAATQALAAQQTGPTQARSLRLIDATGRTIAAAGVAGNSDTSTRPAVLETETGAAIDPLTASGDTVLYTVTAPVTDLAGARLGYVVISRRLMGGTETASLMSGLVGRGGRVLLGNADGTLATDFVKPISNPGQPKAGESAAYADSTGHELFGASVAVGDTPWMVTVEAPRAAVLGAASKFTFDSAIVGVAFVVIGGLLSWFLIRRTMRPLGEVTAAARDIAGGNLTRRAAVRGRSEIAVLGDAFNQMVERVGESSVALASRASQLEASNKELNESEVKYRTLFEHLPDGVMVHRDNRILFANPAALRLIGVGSEAELMERSVLEYIAPVDRELVQSRIAQVVDNSGAVPVAEIRLQRPDRRLATVEVTSMPLRVSGGTAVQTILHDVTERRLLEEQFRQSQKMDAVGRLAGGVAHDFNNLLTVIQAHAEFALSDGESAEDRRRDIEEIRKTAESAARLTKQLLTFSRKQSVVPEHIDLNEAIAGMLGMIHRLIGDNIEVVTVAGKELSGIWADPGQIQQVLLNLAVNARDAMPDGGVLRFETANITVGEGYIGAASASIPEGDYVMLSVQDTGFGMTEEIRTRVFEPFFTTKKAGQGTGLGLSTVYGIVKQAGGHIWVYSEPNMGTAFKVFFPPYVSASDLANAPRHENGHRLEGTGHLLVVEDDVSVRRAVVRALRAAGYTVAEAGDAEAALEELIRDPGIDLMITDMVMPGKRGIALLGEARSHRPELPAIVLSGYSEQPANEMWRVPDHAVFVEKPVSPAELIRRVRQLLAS